MYYFGQFRKTQYDSYLTPLDYTIEQTKVESNLSKGVTFLDNILKLEGSNV